MSAAAKTTSHQKIMDWTNERGGHPATVKQTERGGEAGILRIDFPGYSGEETLEHIEWNDFFDKFEESHLAFLYQDETEDGNTSRFCKFVDREER